MRLRERDSLSHLTRSFTVSKEIGGRHCCHPHIYAGILIPALIVLRHNNVMSKTCWHQTITTPKKATGETRSEAEREKEKMLGPLRFLLSILHFPCFLFCTSSHAGLLVCTRCERAPAGLDERSCKIEQYIHISFVNN